MPGPGLRELTRATSPPMPSASTLAHTAAGAVPNAAAAPFAARLWAYQRERFPLAAYGPLMATATVAAATWSRAARGLAGTPPVGVVLAGLAAAVAAFFILRVADEHKDAEVDRIGRPELPVPRGLVSLAELRMAGIVAGLLAVAANLLAAPRLLWMLAPVAGWMALMTREFFAREWLRARPGAYLASHMAVLPLLLAYLSAVDWLAADARPPRALPLLLAASFAAGVVVEVGRKVRAPEQERPGVETYTGAWGIRASTHVWLGALVASAVACALALRAADAGWLSIAPLALLPLAAIPALRFSRVPSAVGAKRIDLTSGVWTLALYALLGGGAAIARVLP
ncbi:MAG: rane protein [Gemmatimonadetes bacterium]|nr:rane protein [Gemmatimonadota bacterium]